MDKDDIQITKENAQLLSLTEHPVWKVFVQMVQKDMDNLDKISSLVFDGKSPEDITREVMLRYQTRESVITYINEVIYRAQAALHDLDETKHDIINVRE